MGMDWGDYDNDGRTDMVIAKFANQVKPVYQGITGAYSAEVRCRSDLPPRHPSRSPLGASRSITIMTAGST